MMLGNWAQHAFIDPKDPQSGYGNSITCIETLYNKRCFNDGYHIGHHNRPTLHWSEMPGEFEKNRDLYVSRNAIVFRGVDYFGVWFFLMTKNYVALATRLVLQAGTSTLDERVRLLRSRTLAFNKGR
jgi:fatty acid desaturase